MAEVNLDALSTKIQKFSSAVNTVKKLSDDVGTPKDSKNLRAKLNKQREQAKTLAKNLQSEYKAAGKNLDPANKMMYERLGKDFNGILRQYEDALQHSASKEASTKLDGEVDNSQKYDSFKQEEAKQQLQQQQVQQQKQRNQQEETFKGFIATEVAMMEEKHTGMKNIESELTELHQCYVELDTLVNQQNEPILSIAENVKTATIHVEDGTSELKEAGKLQASSRKLIFGVICCVAVAVGLVFMFLGIFKVF